MDETFEIHVLGPTTAMTGGAALDIGGARQRRLLTALVHDAGDTLSADQLIERVWTEDDRPTEPRAALRTTFTRLRQALGPDGPIATEASGWKLDLDRVTIDARRFEELVRSADDPACDVHDRLGRLDEALALWHGAAFEDVAGDEWARAETDRLAELRVTATERRYDAMLTAGMHTDALPGLAAEVESHPLRDRLVGLQMLGLYRSGRQAEATRVFQAHRDRLADELGLEPGPELVDLDRRILAGDPSLHLTTVAGRALRGYRLGEQVGEGAFAVVYRGTQPSVGRDVAVKVIRSELANRPEFVRRFETEAHLVARLEHPYIVPLYDYWREPDRACLVFRYLRGGTLEARLTSRGGLGLDEARTMLEQVGAALATAHAAGVVHRDVKPANVFLDESGNFYLGDFGIALEAAERADPLAALSAGSPAYASPEQLRREEVGPSADVHGLGISLYEALTARLPFPDATSQAELLQRQLHEPIPSISAQRADVPPGVDDVVARATAKDPLDRYQTIDELVAEFAAILAGPSEPAGGRRGTATTISAGAERNPYKGLRAFTEADTTDFFGRERLVDRLVEMLGRPGTAGRIATVVGPSGIGKSSVVRAGLLPALRRATVPGSDEWFVATMLPGRDPFEELGAALLRVATHVPDQMMTLLDDDHRGLARVVKALVPEDSTSEVLLVIDQFEEVFTLVDDDARRRRFLDALEHALTDSRCPLRVVLTMRADFWDRPLRHGAFARLIEHSTVNVTALAPDELERAIVEPALRAGAEFEPGLVSEIVADVTDQPGGLPLLQYALTELWERRISGLLTRGAYRQLGGVTGALARRAEELHEESDVAEQALIRRIFGRLVSLGEGTEDTRRRALRGELGSGPEIDAILDRFGAARLLSFDHDPATREPTVEVAHEALIRQWPRLRTWLDEDRDDLRIMRHLHASAGEWEAAGRPESELYRGGRLEAAEDWGAAHDGEITPEERQFVAAGVALRQREEAEEQARFDQQVRSNRRLRNLLSGVGVLLILALVAGAVAFQQRSRANDQADEASAARDRAETERIAADASSKVADNPQLALLLAAEAYALDPGPAALGALQQTLTGTGSFLGVVGAGHHYTAAGWLDDDRIVAAGPDGLAVYDRTTGEQLIEIDVPIADRRYEIGGDGSPAPRPAAAFSTTHAVVVPADDPSFVSFVDLTTGQVRRGPDEHESAVEAIGISPDGRRAATIEISGVVRMYDIDSGTIDWELDAYPEEFNADFDWPSGYDPSAFIVGLDLSGGSPNLAPANLAFTSDGSELITTAFSAARFWSTTTGEATRPEVLVTMAKDGVHAWRRAQVTELDAAGQPIVGGETFLFRNGEPIEIEATAPWYGMPNLIDFDRLADGSLLAQFTDGRIAELDPDTGELGPFVRRLALPDPGLMAVSADRERVAVPSADGVGIWSLTGQQLIARGFPRQGASFGTISRRGERITAADAAYWFDPALDSPMAHYDVASGEPLVLSDDPRLYSLGYWLDSPYLYSWSDDFRVHVYDADSGERIGQLEQVGANGFAVSATAGYTTLGTGADGIGVMVFPLDGGEAVQELEAPVGVSSLSFSADGSRLAAAWAVDGFLHVWDTDTWELLEDGSGVEGFVRAVRYSPDGRYLVTVDDQGVFTLRDPLTHEPLQQLLGSRSDVLDSDMWFSEDGRFMVAGGFASLSLWDLEAGVQIGGSFPNDPGFRVAGNDGAALMTAIDDHLLVWNLDTTTWADIACQAAGRNLSPAEWDQFGPEGTPYRATCPQWPALG